MNPIASASSARPAIAPGAVTTPPAAVTSTPPLATDRVATSSGAGDLAGKGLLLAGGIAAGAAAVAIGPELLAAAGVGEAGVAAAGALGDLSVALRARLSENLATGAAKFADPAAFGTMLANKLTTVVSTPVESAVRSWAVGQAFALAKDGVDAARGSARGD